MSRLSILFALVVAACGGKSSPPPVAPLPADQPAEQEAKKEAEPPPPPPEEQKPIGPLEVKIEPVTVSVKLVSAGKGKKAPLTYSTKAGTKQQVELALDFAEKHTAPAELGGDGTTSVPTIVLAGDAETKTVGADGNAEYLLTVSSTDARDVKDAKIPADALKQALTSMTGLTIGGTVGSNGAPSGDVSIRLEKPDDAASQIVDMVKITLPAWPYLPKEPIGVGAKWQATVTTKLMGKLPVTHVTDYELVAKKGATWTIKGKTKVTGQDQDLQGSKISAIKGSGTTEATLTDGALYPSLKSNLETEFTATENAKSMTIALKVGGAVTPKP